MDITPFIDAIRVQSTTEAIALPPGIKLVPTEAYHEVPARLRGEARVDSLDSLYQYAREFGTTNAAIFASREPSAKISAVLNWIDGWGDHVATYELAHTPEWLAWLSISGRKMGQLAFAEFVEEHLEQIHSPSAAEVLTIATTLSGKRKIEFNNVVSLANGDKSIQWNELTDAKAAGDIRVPSEITLRIPIFKGSENATTFEIKALFRYRIADGQLSYEVKLLNADKVAGLAFDQIVTSIRKEFEGDHSPLIVTGSVVQSPRSVFNSSIIKN